MLVPLLNSLPKCPDSAAFFGMMGVAASLVFANLGSAYGTAKAGIGIAHLGVMNVKLVMKGLLPVILSGVLGIYGLIISIVLTTQIDPKKGYSSYKGFTHLAAGLSCGLSCLAAGLSLGVVGDAGVRAYGKQPKVFVSLMVILIFGEALGLYGLILAVIVAFSADGPKCSNV